MIGRGDGHAALEYELARERAATLKRIGGRLEEALEALRRCEAALPAAPTVAQVAQRTRLLEAASEALWYVVVQREAMGLTRHGILLETYAVPAVLARRHGLQPPAEAGAGGGAPAAAGLTADHPRHGDVTERATGAVVGAPSAGGAQTRPGAQRSGEPMAEKSVAEKTVAVSGGVITLREDGVLVAVGTTREHTLAQAEENVRVFATLLAGRKAPLVVDMRQVSEMSPAVQRFYAGAALDPYVTAAAIIVGSRLSRLLGNMAIAVGSLVKSGRPAQLFDGEEAALAWARTRRTAGP
jgi:hypothetical protein